jgi:hypothetical protein
MYKRNPHCVHTHNWSSAVSKGVWRATLEARERVRKAKKEKEKEDSPVARRVWEENNLCAVDAASRARERVDAFVKQKQEQLEREAAVDRANDARWYSFRTRTGRTSQDSQIALTKQKMGQRKEAMRAAKLEAERQRRQKGVMEVAHRTLEENLNRRPAWESHVDLLTRDPWKSAGFDNEIVEVQCGTGSPRYLRTFSARQEKGDDYYHRRSVVCT